MNATVITGVRDNPVLGMDPLSRNSPILFLDTDLFLAVSAPFLAGTHHPATTP